MGENIQGLITADLTVEDFDDELEFEEDTRQTTEILHSLGFDWPEADMDYLKRLIGYLNELNYFK